MELHEQLNWNRLHLDQLDGRSMSLESGRYMETVGWLSEYWAVIFRLCTHDKSHRYGIGPEKRHRQCHFHPSLPWYQSCHLWGKSYNLCKSFCTDVSFGSTTRTRTTIHSTLPMVELSPRAWKSLQRLSTFPSSSVPLPMTLPLTSENAPYTRKENHDLSPFKAHHTPEMTHFFLSSLKM